MREVNQRFSKLDTSSKVLKLVKRDMVLDSLRGASAWLDAAVDGAGVVGKCCRNALYHEDGRVTWLYPNSNTAESISAWLKLGELLGDPTKVDQAKLYADTMLDDTVRGLWNDPAAPEAFGLPWYWTDGGTYSSIYAMRIPIYLSQLYQATGCDRYLSVSDGIGETLLNRMLDSGIVSAAWDPKTGWMHEVRVGARVMYSVATFAKLWQMTGKEKYRVGYDKSVAALLRMQNEDGSFYQQYDPRTGEALDTSIKFHFVAYLLNILQCAYEAMGDTRLVDCGARLADHLCGTFYYRHTVPYCGGTGLEAPDQMEADGSIQDSCNGLLWLFEVTGTSVYRDVALKLWMELWMHQIPQDNEAGWAGAIMRGVTPSYTETLAGVPSNRKHLHFDPTVVARCDIWFVANHVFASERLLQLIGKDCISEA
ncbi:pectate lyase [Coraliomargarita sp. SDUM461004]|uniref:Pectate lyase n=1 Tax=Thalassobacterium sedimentorum TaxID=3041258 RepID=A0ABU1ALQ7_9BACT|nr:pectate lyase [Coraliomargarita sp. SDUM461004]MDQ8194785.1 pectate lyase [Coraliomargarita sp. SDUM461004]